MFGILLRRIAAGSKYYGLFYIAAIGVPSLFFSISAGILASICCLLAGFRYLQLHTSDPVFPILSAMFLAVFNSLRSFCLQELFVIEQPVSENLAWYFGYLLTVHIMHPGFMLLELGQVCLCGMLPFAIISFGGKIQFDDKHQDAVLLLPRS